MHAARGGEKGEALERRLRCCWSSARDGGEGGDGEEEWKEAEAGRGVRIGASGRESECER